MTIEDQDAESPPPMSYADLAANGFVWDIALGTGDITDQLP
jgi:hypothetical protein